MLSILKKTQGEKAKGITAGKAKSKADQ